MMQPLEWRLSAVYLAVMAYLVVGPVVGTASSNISERAAYEFPKDFWFGVATSAYQVEGAWDTDGKGENIWDHLLHTRPNFTEDGRNGDVAADSYHKYKEDVDATANLGSNVYRFSISWTRILPTGDVSNINSAGIDYYNKLIDYILSKNLVPFVTVYHFDLPQDLQKLGGWPNPVIVDYYVDYVQLLFEKYGDRVRWWTTFNEPQTFAKGYSSSSIQAPAVDAPGIADYLTVRSVLLAHARAWHLYDEQYRSRQNGKVGIVLAAEWMEAATNSSADREATERLLQFMIGLWANPIFSKDGDFPKVVRQRVDENSRAEGRKRSRLPHFSEEQIRYVKGTADFFGFTHYSTLVVTAGESGSIPSMDHDSGAVTSALLGYPQTSSGPLWRVVPWGIREVLNWLSQSYPGYPLMIVENGCADEGSSLEDRQRIAYIGCYISEVLRAINDDGVNVTSYFVWSLLDNLEWAAGYTRRFGLMYVDFEDPQRRRTPKASMSFVKPIFQSKSIPQEYFTADTADINSICYPAQDEAPPRRSFGKLKSSRPKQLAEQKRRAKQPLRRPGRLLHEKS